MFSIKYNNATLSLFECARVGKFRFRNGFLHKLVLVEITHFLYWSTKKILAHFWKFKMYNKTQRTTSLDHLWIQVEQCTYLEVLRGETCRQSFSATSSIFFDLCILRFVEYLAQTPPGNKKTSKLLIFIKR